jgi:hypothetical protein
VIVESQNYLGIYISRDTATVVCLDSQGKDRNVLGCFSVSVESQEQANMQALAGLIAQTCAERELKFSEVAVALDCAMFMQHSVHSEFSDRKQIAATVRFDTEEALATDIADVALTFEMASSDEAGSELTVFTAQRKILSEVLSALQQYDFDPVTIEPDINCLSRFIGLKASSVESAQGETLYGMLSRRSGYLVALHAGADEGDRKASAVRTFLVGPSQDRGELLGREVLVTTALVGSGEPINRLRVFDSAAAVKLEKLGKKLSIEAGAMDLQQAAGAEPQTLADCADPVDFAIACGAALTHFEKAHAVNFRDDFSPYQGRKLRLQKALKFAAISVTVLLIAVGLYFQTQLFTANKYRGMVNSRFAQEYKAVTQEKLSGNFKIREAVRKLGSLLRRVERDKKGLSPDDESVSSKLTLVLAAFNKCAAQTNLNIKSVTVASRDIIITGDTASRQNRQRFFQEVRNGGLEIVREGYDLKGGRESFSITVVPKK